jgi:DnaJ-class molecular chaperone
MRRPLKKAYYKLSFSLHPDKNPDVDPTIFHSVVNAYNTSDLDQRKDDMKSKFGNNYNEYYELFDVNFNYSYEDSSKLSKFKTDELLNIHINIDDTLMELLSLKDG